MTKIEIHFPRWISIPYLIFIIVFSIVWISIALRTNNFLFLLLGIMIILIALAYGIYTVVTGKAPFFLKSKK